MAYIADHQLRRLRDDQKLLRQEVLMYQRVMEGMRRNLSLDTLLKVVIESVRTGLGFKRAGIFLVDPEGKSVYLALGVDQNDHYEKNKDRQNITSKRGENVFSDLANGYKKFFLTNNLPQRISKSYPNTHFRVQVLNNAVVPIQVERGRMIGALAVDNLMTSRPITRSDISSLMNYATQVGLAIESFRTHEEIRNQSVTDPLTGLYNRRFFDNSLAQELARSQRYRRACSLIMVDIDHFKRVNDVYGHAAGDEIIKQIATLLRENTRTMDIVGRYGGEEFAIILPETPPQNIMVVVHRLLKLTREMKPSVKKMAADGRQVTVSLGVSSFRGGTTSAGDLLKKADQSLYQAKKGGRNRSGLLQVIKSKWKKRR